MRALGFLTAAGFALFSTTAIAGPEAEEPATEEPSYEPTSSKAPDAGELPETEEEPEPLVAEPIQEVEPDTDTTLQEERKKAPKTDFNKHGVGARGGITIIPTWILSRYLETHANALCRGGSIGGFAEKRGLQKQGGCNFYVGGQYIYRQSRILDIIGAIGYHHLHTPDAYWLDKGEYDGSAQSLGAADYTEIKMGMMFIQADFVARYPVVITDTVEFGIGGGAGLGLGIIFGGIYQTPIGNLPDGYIPGQGETSGSSCRTPDDLANFQRCTPRYDVNEDPDSTPPDPMDLSDPNPMLYASCSRGNCSEGDLDAFGYRKKQDDVPPVIPIVNLIISARVIIKDTFGISLDGGWNTGFYFGGSMTYFFGKQFQKSGRSGPSSEPKPAKEF